MAKERRRRDEVPQTLCSGTVSTCHQADGLIPNAGIPFGCGSGFGGLIDFFLILLFSGSGVGGDQMNIKRALAGVLRRLSVAQWFPDVACRDIGNGQMTTSERSSETERRCMRIEEEKEKEENSFFRKRTIFARGSFTPLRAT